MCEIVGRKKAKKIFKTVNFKNKKGYQNKWTIKGQA